MALLVNPAPARMITGELIGLRPILVPNEHEAEALTGERTARLGRLLAGRTGSPVVITLGARGAVIVTAHGTEMIQAPTVEAVDTTGARHVLWHAGGRDGRRLVARRGCARRRPRCVAVSDRARRPHGDAHSL